MIYVLLYIGRLALSSLSIKHIPKQTPPLVKEAALWTVFGQIRSRQIGWLIWVEVVFRIFLAVIAILEQIAIHVASAWTALHNIDRLTALNDCASAIPHLIS